MNMDQLAYLCDLSESGSITATAEKFFISHQGVSKSIRSLENELSTTLILRSSKGVTLTEDGLFVVQKAKNILQEYDAIRQNYPSSFSSKVLRGDLQIVSISRIVDTYLNSLLPLFLKRYPQVKVHIKNVSLNDILQMFSTDSSNAIDIGFLTFREDDFYDSEVQTKLKDLGLSLSTFSCEEIFACLLKALYKKDCSYFSKELYPQFPIVSYKYDCSLSKHKSKNLDYEINSIEVQRNMIENKLAVGMVTNREFEKFYAKKKKFTLMPLSPPVIFYFCYLTSQKKPLSPTAKAFLLFLRQQYS